MRNEKDDRLGLARQDLDAAEALIDKTGYHRRDPEVRYLKQLLHAQP